MVRIISGLFIIFMVLSASVKSAHAKDNQIKLDIQFEISDGLSYTHLKLTNTGKTPERIDTMTVIYSCAENITEIIDHEPRLSLAPGANVEVEGGTVCAARQGPFEYRLLSINQSRDVIVDGETIYRKLVCGLGLAVYVTLEWKTANDQNQTGYYAYTTHNGTHGTLSGKAIEDGSFAQAVCSPSPPPHREVFAAFQEFVRENLFDEDGKAKMLIGAPVERQAIKR